ncbi:MAG TPA: hypothetical protein VL020_03240 [Pseudomonadales bacterium]|nr:hypothetical protein [Pseudomonadales bacterium]
MMGTRLEFSSALTGITTAKEELRAQIAADVAAWEKKNGKVKTMPIVRPLSDKGSFNNQQKATDAQKRVMAILRENPNMMKGEACKFCEAGTSTVATAAAMIGYKFKAQNSIVGIVAAAACATKTSIELADELGLVRTNVQTVLSQHKLPFKRLKKGARHG